MANPNNALGTNGAYGGRTSVNALNDVMSVFGGRGLLSGWACAPDSGMTVVLGGDGNTRDVAIAEDNAGNRTSVNNISGSPVPITLEAAPTTNSRIDAIIAYVDNPPQGSVTIIDNPEAVNLLAVAGTAAASPTAPDDDAIRTAITADGASGATNYYVVLAYVTVAAGTTDITSDMITAGPMAKLTSHNIDFATFEETLWENPTPTLVYAGGTVTYDRKGYSKIAVVFAEVANSNILIRSPIFEVTADTGTTEYQMVNYIDLNSLPSGSTVTWRVRARSFTVSASQIVFSNGVERYMWHQTVQAGDGEQARFWVPIRIIGLK